MAPFLTGIEGSAAVGRSTAALIAGAAAIMRGGGQGVMELAPSKGINISAMTFTGSSFKIGLIAEKANFQGQCSQVITSMMLKTRYG